MFILFRHWFLHRFLNTFLMENGTQMAPKKCCWVPSVCILLASFSEHRLLDAFWSPFGSLLAIFWLPFGTLWYPFARPRVPFSHFWGLLASFDIICFIFRIKTLQTSTIASQWGAVAGLRACAFGYILIRICLKCFVNDSEMLLNDFEMLCLWFGEVV